MFTVFCSDVMIKMAFAREMAAKIIQYKGITGVSWRPHVLPHLVVSLGRQGQLSLQDFSAFRTLKKGFFGGLAVFAVFMVSSGLC